MAMRGYKRTVTGPGKPGSGEGDGRVYTGGTPDFDERTGLYRPGTPNEYLNPPTKKVPGPRRPGKEPKPKPKPVKPEPTPKPKPKKAPGVKRRDVSNEQIKPRRIKPTPSRRRFLDELNEMNKRGGK